MPPGLVSETFAPWRSSAVSLFSRALVISSLKASRNCGNVSRPASLITGTISVRPPPFFSTSTAMPRLTPPSSITCGLPSSSAKCVAITGIVLGRRARDRVRDQVREGDAVAGLLELLAARVEVGDGEGAEGRRGRDLPRLVHVAREHRARALEQGLLAAGRRGAGALAGAAVAPFSWKASTSALPMRPLGPVPLTLARSMPCAAATRCATGRDLQAVGRADRLGVAGGARLGRLGLRRTASRARRRCPTSSAR